MILPIRIWLDPCHQCPAEPMAAYPKSKDFHRFSSYICSILHLNPHLDSNYIYIYTPNISICKKNRCPLSFSSSQIKENSFKATSKCRFLKESENTWDIIVTSHQCPKLGNNMGAFSLVSVVSPRSTHWKKNTEAVAICICDDSGHQILLFEKPETCFFGGSKRQYPILQVAIWHEYQCTCILNLGIGIWVWQKSRQIDSNEAINLKMAQASLLP